MYDLTFDVTPSLDDLQRFITGVEKNVLDDLREFWKEGAQPVVAQEIAKIFATEGYGRWPPLSPAYARQKAKRYPGKTILRRQDRYMQAATRKMYGNIFEVHRDFMIWGVDLGWFAAQFGFPYPVVHERGSTKSRLPARPVFELLENNSKLNALLVISLEKYLKKKIQSEAKRYFRGRG